MLTAENEKQQEDKDDLDNLENSRILFLKKEHISSLIP